MWADRRGPRGAPWMVKGAEGKQLGGPGYRREVDEGSGLWEMMDSRGQGMARCGVEHLWVRAWWGVTRVRAGVGRKW